MKSKEGVTTGQTDTLSKLELLPRLAGFSQDIDHHILSVQNNI